MKHYTFPKIKQYHQVLRDIKLQISYVGQDENDEPIYKEPDTWHIIKFQGRVKLHGTNAAIVFSREGSFYCQSRENIIDEIQDNAGFAHWVNKDGKGIWDRIKTYFQDNVKYVILFGEWCGGSIQKGVALNQLTKRFVIFGLKVVLEDDTTQWLDYSSIRDHSIHVYNIDDYRKYEIDIDLNRPDKAIEQMTQWTTEIGNECPFAKDFGVSGVGEGIVWRMENVWGYSTSFKTKDEKHTISKIKKLPTVDVQKLDSIQEAVDTHCHEDRLQQIYDKIVLAEADKVPQKIGDFVRLVIEDCWEEEGDSIRASDISRKEFGAACSKKIARWFQNKISQL
jgi:hypothetical protein